MRDEIIKFSIYRFATSTRIPRFKSVQSFLSLSFFSRFFDGSGDPSCRRIFHAVATVSRRRIVAEAQQPDPARSTRRWLQKQRNTNVLGINRSLAVHDSTKRRCIRPFSVSFFGSLSASILLSPGTFAGRCIILLPRLSLSHWSSYWRILLWSNQPCDETSTRFLSPSQILRRFQTLSVGQLVLQRWFSNANPPFSTISFLFFVPFFPPLNLTHPFLEHHWISSEYFDVGLSNQPIRSSFIFLDLRRLVFRD